MEVEGNEKGLSEVNCPVCYVLRHSVTCVVCVSSVSWGASVCVIWQHTSHGNSETHAYVSCVLFCYINTKQKR